MMIEIEQKKIPAIKYKWNQQQQNQKQNIECTFANNIVNKNDSTARQNDSTARRQQFAK